MPALAQADLELGGFVETALGARTAAVPSDRNQLGPWLPLATDFSLRETRLQLRGDAYSDGGAAHFRIDVVDDGVAGETRVEAREAYAKLDLGSRVELRAGRQPTTWGTGDLLFVNDLFPKDYVSFFAGREDQYLKLPSSSIRLGIFGSLFSVDLVYTPIFEPDRVTDTDRFTIFPRLVGVVTPEAELQNGEVALRVHRLVGSYELAAYGYRGFWKDPRALGLPDEYDSQEYLGVHSPLRVVGVSARGPFIGGVGWLETGYYHTQAGNDLDLRPFGDYRATLRPPSDVRVLAGLEQSLPGDWTVGGQAYREHRVGRFDNLDILHALGSLLPDLHEHRLVYTLRITKLLRDQTIRLSLFGFYSPSDEDAYLRWSGSYAVSDAVQAVLGANVFLGDDPTTPFGANDPNDNIYGRLRFSF